MTLSTHSRIKTPVAKISKQMKRTVGALRGLGAPKDTSHEIIEKLNKEINAALGDPKLKARIVDSGGTVLPGSCAEFGKLIADEAEKWTKVVKFAGLKPE